jgi:hypothetical protein
MCRVPCAAPAESPRRPELSTSSAILNPCPTSPSRSATGTLTSSKKTVRVSEPHALGLRVHDERCHAIPALPALVHGNVREHREYAGKAGVGDPDLLSGQEVVRPVGREGGRGLHGLGVRAGAGLGEAEPRYDLAASAARQPSPALILRAEQCDALAPDGLVRPEVHGEGRVRGSHFSEDPVEHLGAGAETSVGLGDVHPHEPKLGHALAHTVREPPVMVVATAINVLAGP